MLQQVVTFAVLIAVRFVGQVGGSGNSCFTYDDSMQIKLISGNQLLSIHKLMRFSRCGDAADTDAGSDVQLFSTSKTTGRILLSSPRELAQCGEDLKNQIYWTWTLNCSYIGFSGEWSALLPRIRLSTNKVDDQYTISATNTDALMQSCQIFVNPVLNDNFYESASTCREDSRNDSLPHAASDPKLPVAAMYKPLVTASGSVEVSVTYSTLIDENRWFISCDPDARFQPYREACLPIRSAANWSLTALDYCDRWVLFTQYSSGDHDCLTVVLNGSTHTVPRQLSYMKDGKMYVCETALTGEHDDSENLQKLAERSLFIISAIADLANILVHLTLRAQRTLPGRIVLCLSSTLFASDLSCFFLTFLRSLENLWVCFAVRSLAHCLSLSASCWTQVLWYDLWLTISASRTIDTCRHLRTRFCRYVLFSWAIPIAFPATRFIVDLHTTLYMPSNDDHDMMMKLLVCNHQPLFFYLAFSAIPVSCILLMNTIFLTRSCCLIRRVVRDTERVGISNTFMNAQQRFGLYTKLFFLCGFTSLFGFASEILKSHNVPDEVHEVLSGVSGILDSSLGLCVSLPFLCEPRVGIRVLRAVFIRKQKPPARRRALPNPMNRNAASHVLCNHMARR